MLTIFDELAEPFPPERIHWRVGSTNAKSLGVKPWEATKGVALAYVNARDVMERLDEVVGPENWQDDFVETPKRMMCRLSIRVDGEWITKADGAGDTNMEGEKGGFSDAFKRAAVKFGIGRYLYDCEAPWIDLQNGKLPKSFDGSLYLSAFSSKQLKTKYYKGLKAGAADDDSGKVRELWDELSNEQRMEIWRMFGSDSGIRSTIKALLDSTESKAA